MLDTWLRWQSFTGLVWLNLLDIGVLLNREAGERIITTLHLTFLSVVRHLLQDLGYFAFSGICFTPTLCWPA
jgi:hypothetical protein